MQEIIMPKYIWKVLRFGITSYRVNVKYFQNESMREPTSDLKSKFLLY